MPDFGKWSPQELQKAESAAKDFLDSNSNGIADTFERRLALLTQVTARFKLHELGFDERMLCLSVIEDLSHGLADSAREFFEIGCAPSVASLMLR